MKKKPKSLNEKLQDAYIRREIVLRRVAAGVSKQLDERIVELGNELAALTRRIDPATPTNELERMRRRKQLEKEGSALINKRMAEIKVELTEALKQVGINEASFARKLLEEALNGLL